MPILYNIATAILALTGCFSLLMTGGVGLLMSVSGVALIPGYYRLMKSRPPAPRWSIGLLSVVTLAVFAFESVVTGDVFLAVAHLTIAFQAIKSYDLREPWDHLQVYFMSLLQLIIASELTHSLLFGAVFLLFMVVFVTAMVLSHFLTEDYRARPDLKRPVLVISLLTIMSTLFFFVIVPRTPFRFMGKDQGRGEIKTTGFSDRVDIGSFGDVKKDPTVVMRIEMKNKLKGPFYWRGLTLDYFDGLAWRKSVAAKRNIPAMDNEYVVSRYRGGKEVEQKVFLEPLDSKVIFGLSRVRRIEGDSIRVRTDYAGDIFFARNLWQGAYYSVYSTVTRSYPGVSSRLYLQLPGGMERVAALARRISSSFDTEQGKAEAVEDYLKRNYKYSLSVPKPPPGVSPVENFLFRSRKGYCEYYATSMVVMLRSLGIPARIVNGFHGGERNEYGGYIIVRQSDAHSWVEALINGMWTRFDPTPSVPEVRQGALSLLVDSLRMSWARYVVGFSFADQRRIVRAFAVPVVFTGGGTPGPSGSLQFRPLFYLISLMIVLGFVVWFLASRVHLRRYDFVSAKFVAVRRILVKKGLKISPATTTGEIRRDAGQLKARAEIERFLDIYESHRFGERATSPADRRDYFLLLKKIRKS